MQNRHFAADAEFEEERARLRLLEQVRDPTTIRHLMRELGVTRQAIQKMLAC